MRVVFAAFLTLAFSVVPALAQDSSAIREWIEDLGHDKIEIRTAGELNLLKAGRASWPLLQAAEGHTDPEIASRATQILHRTHLRRKIPYQILRYHPNAIHTLQDGATREKLKLISTFGRYYQESKSFLITLSMDPNPRIAVAASDALYDNRDFSWVEHLLDIYVRTPPPLSPRISRLLVAASTRIPEDRIQELLYKSPLEGKSRVIFLANNSDIPLSVPSSVLNDLLIRGTTEGKISALRWIRKESALEEIGTLLPLLNSADPTVLSETLTTIRVLQYPIPIESILPLLSHSKATVRRETLRLLKFLDEPTTARVALEKLSDPSTTVRKVALEFLWKIRGKAILPTVLRIYLEEGSEQGDLAANYLIQNWEWAQPRLYQAVKSKNVSIRHRAFCILYRITGTLVLGRAMKDPEEIIRLWALRRVLSRNHPSTVATLEKLTKDHSSHIRFEAIRGLVRRGKREKLEDLLPYLEDNDYLHQIEAAETLFDYSRDQILTLARVILQRNDAYKKRIALDALTTRQIFDAMNLALPCLHSGDPRLRRSAARYISQALSHRTSGKIIALLRDSLPTLKGEKFTLTFQLLTTHGDETCKTVILKALREGKGTSHHKTLRALCSWWGESSQKNLIFLLGDNSLLNKAIFRQLKQRARKESPLLVATIDRLLAHPDHNIRSDAIPAALELTPDLLEEKLSELLKDEEPEVRFEAIIACRKIKKKRGGKLLRPLLDDEDPSLRLRVAENLLLVSPEDRSLIQRSALKEECTWVRKRLETLLKKTDR